MKKYFKITITTALLCTVIVFGGARSIFAATPATVTVINARILPTVWYSTLSVNDGDSIKIYAGIQNNSGVNFSGTAGFYVDNQQISSSSFSSISGNLIDISSDWVAIPGNHSVQVVISPILNIGMTLVSITSDKSSINIVRNITPAAVQNAVYNTATNIVNQTNGVASNLANTVEGWKDPLAPQSLFGSGTSTASNAYNPVGANGVANSSNAKKPGSVLGASAASSAGSNKNVGSENISPFTYVYNTLIDLLAFLIRKWMWTLGGIVALYIIYKIIGKFRKD